MRELAATQVDLWLCDLEHVSAATLARHSGLLSTEERTRLDALRFERHRLQFLAAHAMLRHVLALYVPVAAGGLRFVIDRWGRPALDHPASPPGPGFNLSHTDGFVACAVARTREIGIDVERIDRQTEIMDVARHSFSPNEVALLTDAPPDRRRELFFRLWTLKEAYTKALGEGLARPLDSFMIDLAGNAPKVRDSRDVDADRWHFFEHLPAVSLRLAVATSLPHPSFHRFDAASLLA